MIIVSVILFIGVGFFCLSQSARYWLKSAAKKHFITADISPEFNKQFATELAWCTVPCKKLVGTTDPDNKVRFDNRPIIPAAGQLLINEERCKTLSSKALSAGLEYEQAHIQRYYYVSIYMFSAAIIIVTLPLIHFMNIALHGFTTVREIPIITFLAKVLGKLFDFYDSWGLFFKVPLVLGLATASENLISHSLIRHLVYHGRFSEGLLAYLIYLESNLSCLEKQEFNTSNDKEYLEKLLEKQKSE